MMMLLVNRTLLLLLLILLLLLLNDSTAEAPVNIGIYYTQINMYIILLLKIILFATNFSNHLLSILLLDLIFYYGKIKLTAKVYKLFPSSGPSHLTAQSVNKLNTIICFSSQTFIPQNLPAFRVGSSGPQLSLNGAASHCPLGIGPVCPVFGQVYQIHQATISIN
jgi:hypothetical protein